MKPEVHVFQSNDRFDADGNLVDEATIGLVQGLLTALKDKIDATA
ncbi:hypothetical protein [Streptomyces aureus]|nr:hypothetical protein [Streptomyces aureus]